MNIDYPNDPSEPNSSWADPQPPVKPTGAGQDAFPIPEDTDGGAILYPSDPSTYPGPAPSDPMADLAGMLSRDLSEPLGDLSRAVRHVIDARQLGIFSEEDWNG